MTKPEISRIFLVCTFHNRFEREDRTEVFIAGVLAWSSMFGTLRKRTHLQWRGFGRLREVVLGYPSYMCQAEVSFQLRSGWGPKSFELIIGYRLLDH